MDKAMEKANKILVKEFGKNRKMYMATSYKEMPRVMIKNMCYCEGSFYLVSMETSKLNCDINHNPKVSICTTASFHKFQGKAHNLGHPLKDENVQVREILISKMKDWYFDNYDETDDSLSLLQIKLECAFVYANKIGYNIDFRNNEIESHSFIPFS